MSKITNKEVEVRFDNYDEILTLFNTNTQLKTFTLPLPLDLVDDLEAKAKDKDISLEKLIEIILMREVIKNKSIEK